MKVNRQKISEQADEDRELVKRLASVVFDDDRFTDWEQDFVSDLAVRYEDNRHYVLSDRQREVLEKIDAKW